ncbi:ATP-binding protein [Sphingomonas baiyangensis]|uniref:ATP-binding protein n=1 Tax=Sphingomonas baiyangensis TaxID=2572576 RepID=A0A4U1L626_9SPHN|nr:ATP-binding protein [Sphingomonas baiyangensis]
MRLPLAELAVLPPAQRATLLNGLTRKQLRELEVRWWAWAHPGQLAPPGDWRVWLIRAGRGFGKTRAGAEWISEMARTHRDARIALVGGTIDDVARVMIDGPSGLIDVAWDDQPLQWRRDAGTLRFKSGARAFVYSAEAPEGLRGPEHDFAWCDELGKWGRGGTATWDNLMMGMRRGERPRTLVTTTPRATTLLKRVMALPDMVETRGKTRDNPALPPSFVAAMLADYGDTALGRQELDGELIEDVAGALWSRALIERVRVVEVPLLVRVVVGVDPPASATGDACGIVAVGLGVDDIGYVIDDASVAGASPATWARAVAACAERHGADRVIAEANQGGDMVAGVLKGAEATLPVKLVRATRGKVARAEPVAALYESGRVRHAGAFGLLEDELCGLVPGGGYQGPGRSPDRADACIWALTELLLRARKVAAVRRL